MKRRLAVCLGVAVLFLIGSGSTRRTVWACNAMGWMVGGERENPTIFVWL